MIGDSWERYNKNSFICRLHDEIFPNEKTCSKCINNPPLFPVEVKKDKKGVSPNDRTPLSSIEIKAYDWFRKGHSFSWISKQLKVSKSTAWGYVQKGIRVYKANKGIALPNDKGFINGVRTYKGKDDKTNSYKGVRLHNDSISILIEPVDLSMEKDCIKLKYSKYLLIKDYPSHHIQLFSKKLIIQFLEDVEGKTEQECFDKALSRIKDFLKVFCYKGVRLINNTVQQVSRHYAIIGSDLAKHFINEKKKVIVLNENNKGVRLRIDFSHRIPELDTENVLTGKEDSQIWTSLIKDSVEKPIDLLSVTKGKIDFLQENFIKNTDIFTKRLEIYAEEHKKHDAVLSKMLTALDKIEKKFKS
jgi:hypothetical protein